MKDDNCIFCKLANGDIPTSTIYEDDCFRVILDLGPATRGHCLILPKDHAENLMTLSDAVASRVLPLAGKLGCALMKTLNAKGFNVVQNNGETAGQTVMHFHTHIIPRYGNDELLLWKPNKAEPEELDEICRLMGDALQ